MSVLARPPFYRPPGVVGPSKRWVDNGLVALFDVSNGIEVVENNVALVDNVPRAAGELGDSPRFSGSSTTYQRYQHRPGYAQTGAMSFFIAMDVAALTNYGGIIAKQATTTTYCPYELRLGTGTTQSNINFLRASATTYRQGVASGSDVIAANSKFLAMVVRVQNESTNLRIHVFLNGVFSANNLTSTIAAADNGSDVWIGRRFDGVTKLSGGIYHIGLLNRWAEDDEVQEFSNDPSCLFSDVAVSWVPDVASGPPTLAALSASNITATGARLTVTA